MVEGSEPDKNVVFDRQRGQVSEWFSVFHTIKGENGSRCPKGYWQSRFLRVQSPYRVGNGCPGNGHESNPGMILSRKAIPRYQEGVNDVSESI